MPRPTDERTRVLGPTWIPSRQRWRIIVITPTAPRPEDRQTTSFYRTEDEANEVADAAKLRLCNITMGDAINRYEKHLAESGTLPVSYQETCRRLRLFFTDHEMLIGRISPDRAKKLYDVFRARLRLDGRPISVAYHRAALINARSLMTWTIEQKWIAANPFAEVKGIGKRNAGKPQHTADELERFSVYCIERAEGGDRTALGVLMALSMALRSADLCRRVVRDVDHGGTVLRVSDGKTETSNRPRRIPVALQPLARDMIVGRRPLEPLFKTPYTETGHHTHKWLYEGMVRFCEDAGVPFVCPHALKGTAGNILAEDGELADKIMAHLSHSEKSTTTRHYVDGRAMESHQAGRAFEVIVGGKRDGAALGDAHDTLQGDSVSCDVSSDFSESGELSAGGSSPNRTENLTRMKRSSRR